MTSVMRPGQLWRWRLRTLKTPFWVRTQAERALRDNGRVHRPPALPLRMTQRHSDRARSIEIEKLSSLRLVWRWPTLKRLQCLSRTTGTTLEVRQVGSLNTSWSPVGSPTAQSTLPDRAKPGISDVDCRFRFAEGDLSPRAVAGQPGRRIVPLTSRMMRPYMACLRVSADR